MVLFKRRQPRHWLHDVRETFWPSAGWSRTAQYFAHRVDRLRDTPYSIATGLAVGVAISFTPFIGLHLVFAFALAWVLGGNLVATAIGTIIGNPWTFPFIWVLTYQTGIGFLSLNTHADVSATLASVDIMGWLFREVSFMDAVYAPLRAVFLPMMIGSIPFAALSWVLVYFPVKKVVKVRQHRKTERRRLKKESRQKKSKKG